MARTVKYLIAQHVADLFRREPKNVGVFVEIEGTMRAKFAGETMAGAVDRRKVRGLNQPGVYAQWIKYWRRVIDSAEADAVEKIKRTATGHYRVLDGGMIDSIGDDSIDDVLNYVYAMLVSEGGLAEAMGVVEEQRHFSTRLRDAVGKAFADLGILGEEGLLGVRYPVRSGVKVRGRIDEHEPAFVQENHQLVVMETVDFTKEHKPSAKDHAGWAALMLGDIREAKGNDASTYAIVRVRKEDKLDRNVSYGLRLLEKRTEVVNWLDDSERSQFVDQRLRTARGQ